MTSAGCSHKPSRLLLVLNGAEERLQLVLGTADDHGVHLLASHQWTVPGQSMRFLAPGLKQTLDSFGLDCSAIEKIACVTGPGSFTGLRMVLAAAEGIAAGSGQSMAGLEYLPLLAAGPAQILSGVLHVVTYARRGLVYLQSFQIPARKPLTEPNVLPVADLPARLAATVHQAADQAAAIMGSGLRKNPDLCAALARALPDLTQLDALWDNPTPDTLLAAAASADYGHAPLVPLYLRPSDAEDNLPQIAERLGLDPEEAVRRLEELRKE